MMQSDFSHRSSSRDEIDDLESQNLKANMTLQEINTRTLDHIVYLTPPGTLDDTVQEFREHGFHVLPGGTHADGLTANALVVFQDHSYIEIIHFTHPPSYYAPGSTLRLKRDSHPWSESFKKPGFIDFAFLGNGSFDPASSISETINKRAAEDGSGVLYAREQRGGRTRPDGTVLEWLISAPEGEITTRGVLPFFCGDVTPRQFRVPTDLPSNTEHPSGVTGVAQVEILVKPGLDSSHLRQIQRYVTSVAGVDTDSATDGHADDSKHVWKLNTPSSGESTLVVGRPRNADENLYIEKHGEGVHKVLFKINDGGKVGRRFKYAI